MENIDSALTSIDDDNVTFWPEKKPNNINDDDNNNTENYDNDENNSIIDSAIQVWQQIAGTNDEFVSKANIRSHDNDPDNDLDDDIDANQGKNYSISKSTNDLFSTTIIFFEKKDWKDEFANADAGLFATNKQGFVSF
jgi:hypothetical protein